MRVLSNQTDVETFTAFVEEVEYRLRCALSACLGSQVGREAAAEALAYGWEHWDRIRAMENPAGYLYTVGRSRGRRAFRRRPVLYEVDQESMPWIEPGLPDALAALPEQQRIAVMLHHCFQWTLAEIADLLEVSKSTAQKHTTRGVDRLRKEMRVSS